VGDGSDRGTGADSFRSGGGLAGAGGGAIGVTAVRAGASFSVAVEGSGAVVAVFAGGEGAAAGAAALSSGADDGDDACGTLPESLLVGSLFE
jgi:hypothetical protein